jgi:hypothetical protein
VTAQADQLMLKALSTLNEAQARWFVVREVLAGGRGDAPGNGHVPSQDSEGYGRAAGKESVAHR